MDVAVGAVALPDVVVEVVLEGELLVVVVAELVGGAVEWGEASLMASTACSAAA